MSTTLSNPLILGLLCSATALLAYLRHVNRLLSTIPEDLQRVKSKPWTRQQLKGAYARLEEKPADVASYADRLPGRLERRYLVTGGSGKCLAPHDASSNEGVSHHR